MKEIIFPPGTKFIIKGIEKHDSKIHFMIEVKTKED